MKITNSRDPRQIDDILSSFKNSNFDIKNYSIGIKKLILDNKNSPAEIIDLVLSTNSSVYFKLLAIKNPNTSQSTLDKIFDCENPTIRIIAIHNNELAYKKILAETINNKTKQFDNVWHEYFVHICSSKFVTQDDLMAFWNHPNITERDHVHIFSSERIPEQILKEFKNKLMNIVNIYDLGEDYFASMRKINSYFKRDKSKYVIKDFFDYLIKTNNYNIFSRFTNLLLDERIDLEDFYSIISSFNQRKSVADTLIKSKYIRLGYGMFS